MARVDASGWLQKWGTRLNSAQSDMKTGAMRVTRAPGESAAAAAPLMLQRITESINSGLWAKNVSAVTLAQWQDAFVNKGIGRVGAGVTAAQKTKGQVITNLLNAVDVSAAKARSLPKGTIENSIARAAAFMTEMHNQKANIKS
jgi:hypothetical protein